LAWRKSAVAAIMAAVCLSAAGCGEGPGMKIDWDLSARHTLDEVTWQKENLDLYTTSIEPVESVRIRLPDGKVLRVPDRVKRIGLYRRGQEGNPLPGPEGNILYNVEVYSDPLDVDDAYRLAVGYAKQFDLPRSGVEAWRKRRDQGVDPVVDPVVDRTYIGKFKAKKEPIVGINFLYSANDEHRDDAA